MIRVAVIYPSDPFGSKVGGPETFIRDFIRYAPQDFEIRYVGLSGEEKRHKIREWAELMIEGRRFHFFPLFVEKDENKKSVVPLVLRFTFWLFFHKPPISSSVFLFDRIEPAWVFKNEKDPKIGVVHNDIIRLLEKGKSEVWWSRFPRLYFWFEKRIFSLLSVVYTVSEKTLQYYRDNYKEQIQKFVFLPTWVDQSVFYPFGEGKKTIRKKILEASRDSLPPDGKWILFVGRLQEQKAPKRLIETFFEYQKKEKNSVFLLIGDGNLKEEIQKHVAELSLQNKVFLVPNMRQKELAAYYQASDLLLLTSNFEGMPRCVLEALGSGLPVVTTDVGEVRKVVRNGFSGEISDSLLPGVIGGLMEKVLANPEAYSKENCVQSILDYSPKKVLEPVYQKMRELFHEHSRRNLR
ncbi:MAG: hypothetical protein A2787_01110 [Omnitrophica WOR_2 bacterium RIFCSPHIGHO2_01_FULL_48_9]|nr:MAG: hypothetical protein A2787_01110 [Omnitrophica WOR_2 bacterium RIFCSPHIGHO2_01_FULL_48_9]